MKEQGFYFRPEFYQAAEPMEAKDRLAFYDAILDYWFRGKISEQLPSPGIQAAFKLAKLIIDQDARARNEGK